MGNSLEGHGIRLFPIVACSRNIQESKHYYGPALPVLPEDLPLDVIAL
jgi:hypothetical protein